LHAVAHARVGEFALHFELAELRLVIGVGNRAGRRPSPMLKLTS
jgi:hypothetical protein